MATDTIQHQAGLGLYDLELLLDHLQVARHATHIAHYFHKREHHQVYVSSLLEPCHNEGLLLRQYEQAAIAHSLGILSLVWA